MGRTNAAYRRAAPRSAATSGAVSARRMMVSMGPPFAGADVFGGRYSEADALSFTSRTEETPGFRQVVPAEANGRIIEYCFSS